MKKIPSFSALFTSILMVLSVASATWAATETEMSLTYDDDDGSYYVNMPYLHDELIIGTLTLTANDLSTYADPSTGEISFKVYDDGGKSETYSADPASVLQIIVPEGYVLTLNGQIMTESINLASGRPYAYLNVYDAPIQNEEALIAEYVNSENVWGAVGPYVSTSNAMTLYFTAWDVLKDGLDLTVGVHQTHAITVNTLVAGGVVSGMTSAYENQTATLTATPENGYAFVKAVVIDGDGNSVDVTRSGNTFSFAMPTSDVTVTPYFADPTVLSFDENGCLNNGTHFHVECENSTCTISQGLQDNPQEGVSDFRCWSDLQQHIDGDEGLRYSTIVLGESLNLGGYDEENAKCRMSFVPLGKNQSFSGNGHSFNGNDHTIENFCYIGENSAGFFEKSNSSLTFERVTFKNAYVATTATTGYERAGVLGSEFGNATFSDITIDGATVTGSVVGGVAGNITGMQSLEGTISNVVVKNSTISASINGGALAGVAYIYMSESSLFTDNTITGTGNLGGVVGKLEGAYGGKPVSVSGTSITTSSNTGIVGGFAAVYSDSTAYVMGGERGIIQQFSFKGSLSGGSMVGGIFGRVALSSVRYMIKNCYSVGDISGTGADTDELGYIIGSMYGSPTESDSIYNNYHSGSDEVELGIGGSTYTAELWSAGSGSVFSNVRNAFGSLTANTLGYHKIDWYDNGNEGSSVDFFAGTVGYYEAVIRTVNGVVAETDMTSGLLAAMMNYNLESKGESAVWISKSNSLPTFATSSDEPNHMVVVVARGLPNPTGLESVNESYLKDNGDSEGGTVAYGFTAYTDATGSLASTKFEDVWKKIEAIQENYRNDAILVDNDGNIVSASTPINSYQVWHFTTPSTYDVVYKYCFSATNCVPFENVTTTALGFMTPKIDSYAESAEAPLQLVPNVVDYSEVYHTASGLKFTFELQDESGNTIQGIASGDATPQGTEIWSFEDIAQKIRAAGIEDAKTIVLKYSTPSTWYGEFPLLEVENPKLLDFEVDVYAYDRNSSMVQVIESSASGDYAYGSVEYGAAIKISKIKEVIGYNFDNTYSIAYQYKATLDGCTPSEQPVSETTTQKNLGTVDELVTKMSACGTAEWVVDNLNTESATDLVILDNAKMASFTAQRKYGNNVSERVVITPNYTLVQYNLSFNLNLPDDLGVDSSSVFLGRNWAAVKTMDVEHPTLPKVYTTSCPKMKGWSWVADTSVFQEWDTKYVTTFSDRYGNSFVNYATFDEENGNAASAFGYWPSSCTDSDVPGMPLVFAAMEDNSPVLNNSKFHGNIVLKQSVDGTNDISHKSKMVQNVDAAGYHYQTTLPVVDDTLSFIVEVSAEKGYTIEGITFVGTEKENHGIDETDEEVTLGFDEPELTEATTHVTSTLAVNTAMLTAMQFNVTFNYMRYNVEFVRPTDESAVGVSEVYVPDTYSNDQWMDGHVYTAEDVSNYETNVMPQLYATGKCMVWSENPSYLATDSVYTAFNWIAVNEFGQETKLYPIALTSEMDSDHCSGGPTETFTVTANVNLPDGLARLELRQVIGVEGDGDHADTIKHEMVQDGTSSKFTLEIPKVALSQAETESYVPFTFEIHAVTKDGYTTYSNSYYRKITDAGEEISETIAGGTLTTNGNDEEFYVDLIDGDYTIAFDTTGWDHFVIPFSGDYTNYRYDIYIADEDIDQFETYTKPDGSTRLPKFYAATDEGANNTSQTWAIAGWTIYADSAFCMLGSRMENGTCVTSSSKNLFTTFSGDLIVAAKKASLDDGFFENKVIKLYPVWTSAAVDVTYAGINKIKASCPEQTDGCDDNDRPMVLTASQTFTLNGESITLKHSSDVFIPVPWEPGNRSITLDIDFQANPGYEFNSVTLQNASEDEAVYTPADKKLRLITQTHETNVNFVPVSLSYTPYTLTFDISSLDSEIVAFGQSWYDKVDAETGKAVMNVGTANEFPNLYALHSGGDYGPYSFNEVYWTKEQAPENETEWNAWYGTYITSSMKQPFNSDLVTQYFGENSTETAMTAYPMIVSELINGYDARDAWVIWFKSENTRDPKSYHGSVVISQTWNGKTYKQKSKFGNSEIYEHALLIPKADDTLVYNISLDPDPGYVMKLDTMPPEASYRSFGWSDDDGGSANPPEGEDWGYNLDPEVMTLKVQPSRMSSWANEAYVSFTVLHYNVEFSRPTDAEVFVASKWVSDNKYEVDWFESQTDVTVNNIKTPILYDENGCQVYWKVKDSEAHVDTGIVGELVYMTSTETLETAINVLVPDTDESNRNCDNAETYKQTLTVEGEGTILLEQVIGDAPESPEDPAQVVLAHSFVEDEATGVLTLNVPAAYNEVGPDFLIEQTGIKFRVVAVPAENYTLDKISYETAKNGNVMTVTVEDSAEVNVMESLPWTVKFKSLAPIYVTYDLSLVYPDDSADTYLPTNATKSETLELANNADTVSFWKPYRVSTCFQGWSTTAAANYTADDSAYTTFNAGNFTEFSTNPDNPTTLYAIWGDCPEIRNLWTVENSQMNATLVLYQLFGDDTLFHEVSNRRGVTLEGDAFDVYVDPVKSAPKAGYHYAADAKYELSYQYALPVTEGSDPVSETVEVEPDAENGGVWHLTSVGIPSTPTYTFKTDVEMMNYLIVFDVNAGDAPVFYGTDWTKEKTLTVDSGADEKKFPVYQRRTDACFAGWDLTTAMGAGPYHGFDDVVNVLNDIIPTHETVVINDVGDVADRDYYKLYAIWDEDCEPSNYTLTTEVPAVQGSFRMVQKVDDEVYVYTLDGDHPLTLPKDHYVEYDTVKFVPATGYTLAADAEVSIVYSREDENFGVHTFANGSRHNFNDSTGLGLTTASLEISGLNADAYELVFVDNTGEAEDKPFLGDSWADFLAEGTLTEDESGNWMLKVGYNASSENKGFPIALYRNGQCLAGYTFAAGDNTDGVYKELSDAFLLKLAELENPVTLYPYWEDCENVYTVSASDAEQGVLTLTQKFVKGETEYVRNYIVEDGGIALSSTNDVTFKGISFAPNEGSNLVLDAERAYSYRADAETEWADLAVPFTVTSDMEIKAPLLLQAEFALDAGFDDVFYGPGFSWNWSSDGVAFGAALPTNLYRVGYKLAGWKFDNEETPMLNLNEDFAAAYSAYAESHGGDYPDTLHAVWTVSGVIPAYSLQLTEETLEQNAGVLTLSQTIGDSTIVHVFEDGMLNVPMVEDLALTVNFAIDTAHSFDGETPITLKSYFTEDTFGSYATGDELVVHTEVLGEAGTVMVNVATKVDSYEFAFDINVGEDDQVFYGKDWFATKSYDMSEEELDSRFPASAYQTQNCLGGFAFTAMEPLEDGYTITMPDVKFYTGIDSAFIADYKALEEKPTTLYAVWLKPGVHCSAITSNVMISALNTSEEGEFTLTNADMEIKLPASEESAAVQVPVADDLEFTVTFTPTSAYDFDAETGTITISLVDGYDYTLVNAKTYSFAKNATLKATPTLKAVAFDLNANAGEASVFYGKEYAKTWTSTGVAYGDELPKNIYRADAKFVGWAFAALEDNATEGFFTKFDKDFMDAYAAQETVPTTLYAVWKTDDERATYKIASASTDAGDLLVAQFVGEDSLGYAVTAAGLTVPAESDLEFKAYFTVNMEHTLASVSQPLTLMNADEEETPFGTIANGGAFTLQGNTSIVANTSDDAYEFVLDVNAGDATVFYGTNWVENLVVEMTDATASRDFPTSIYRTDKCLQGFSFDSENQETYYEGITEEFVTAFKDGGYSSPKTLYAVWGDCPDDHKNVSVTVANTAAEGWFSLGNYVGDIENEFDLDEDHESLLVPVADDLEFTVSFVSGGAYTFNGVINVLDADAETPTLVKELHSTDTYTFTRNVKLQAVTEFVKVELVFDLNVDDANVFFTSDFDGLTWNVNDYGDEFPSKIVRADKVFAGWGFTRDASEGFTVYDNDFVIAYNEFSDSHDLTNVPVTLYALWIDAPEAIETYHVSLQNSYDGKLTLSQSNAGVVTEYEVGADGIDIPVNANREFRVTFDADYAYSLAAGTPITISEISSMGNVTDETSIANGGVFEFDANSVISVEMGADKYILAFDVNAGDADVFYGTNWFASKTYDMADEDLVAKFPTSVYQNGKCLSGYTFDAAGTGDVFTEINPDFISAYKALEEAPEKLYAVWYTGDCDQASVTVASGNKDHEATFVLTNAGKDYEVSEENPVEVPVASDLEFTVAFTAGSAYSTDDKFSVVMGNSTDAQVSGDTYTFTRNAELLANVNLKLVNVALKMNAGEANVFYARDYENVWDSEDVEYGTELPKNVYRADADLLGWAFEAIEDDAAEVWFTKFDNDFVEAYAAASAGQGDDPTPLYAVWKTNTERATYTITSTEETLGAGNLVVAQWAFADSVGYAVGADGLKVPAENNLIFRAYFEPLNTHSVVGDLPVALDVDGEVTNVFVGQDFVLAGNTEITVATENDVYVLAFDANADGATLFYGDNWFSGKTYSPADAEEDLNFPTSLYRIDKCLDGFAFNADESVVYKSISDEFITEFKERELTSPVTLVAVWKNCPETYANYTVAAKDASEGVFTLTNKYGEIANKFEVGSEALVIPAAEDLTFSVTFAENVTVDYENKVSVLAGDETVATVADGATVSFSQNSELKAVASVLDLTFAFDANKAANDTVFYNSEWSATKSYDLADEEFDYHFPTAYQTSKCLAGFAFSKTATESEAFQEVGVDFIKAYKALEVKPTTLYAVWTTEDCNHGYVVLRSGNTEAEGSFTISDAVNSYELSAGSLMAVPTHVVDFKVTFHEGRTYELKNIDVFSDDQTSNYSIANETECRFDENTILKANVEPKSKGLVFALNAEDATVFYGTSYDPKWFENLMNGDFYNDNLPSGIYRNDAVFMGWSFTQMSGVAEGSKYFTKIDDDFYEAFKNHAETRENFDTPDTLYAVWKSAPNREIYTVTVGNKASEGKFRLTNASGGLSNEFLVDATTMLVIPAENDLVFTVSFVSASETAEYEGISVISTTGTQIAVIEMGDEYTFRKDVMLRAISYMPTMEFALDVNAGDADVFYESDFGFKWWASSYGQYLPTGIYRTDAKLVGWSLDKNATPDKAFKEIDDAFNEAVESYMEHYGEDLIGDISEGDFDLSKIQEMYGMDFAQMSRGPVLYAVWEKADVKTVSVKSNSLRQGTLTLQQLVDDSTFTFVVGEKGLKVPYVEGGLEFRAHFEANESHLLNSGKSLVWNAAAAADTTKNDEFVLVSEPIELSALVKVVGFNLAFNAESKETLFYGDDWTSGKKVIAKGTSASQFPTMVYSASRCLVGWTLKNDVVAYTEMQDELANKLYEKYPKLTDTTKINMYALWSDSPDQCSALMTRVSVEQDKGEVMLVEKTGESNEVVHKFNEKGSMMLPSDIVSAEWTLRSAPDSSYALDSLTIVRNDKLLAVLREGGNLPGNMDNAVFKAHFSKANKTPVEIVERHFAQSGNAIQLNIKASEFEVTRGVEARVRVFDVKDDSVVLDSLLGDSVAMGFESEVVLRMKRTGDYKVVLTLEDEKESDAFEQEFGVKSSIASVGKDGWQMVSLAAVDTSAINWTSDDQVFYWWDEFGNGGDYWQYKRYNRGDSVVATRGAWYSSLDSLPLVLKRDIEDDGEDAVWKLDSIHSGWNLVANTHGWEVSLFAGHADEEKDVDEESEISFYRYNSETADYEETKYLKPYEAVWAKVGKKKNWKVSAAPVFAKATELEPQPEKPEGGRMLPKRVLAKASTKDRWVLQAVLSDKNGKQDAWNILGAGNNPFSAEEPPESMGDHVNLSIVEGKRALAKSIKSASDEMEWTVALSASNDRVGYLTLVGIDDVNAFGYRVFVTVDGNTTEMKDGVPLQVLLKSNAKTATVRVAPAAKVVAQNSLKGLRSARLGGKLKVSFEATGLAGTNARVDLLDMKGHVMSTVNAKTLEGTNALVLDAPKSGLYMLRVRAGSQQQAAKVMVK